MSEQQYIVSARKYRPATFKTVVGQQTLTNTLKNAISSDRIAQAYLFCGPRGVGKTSCARIFAKTINCLHPTADGEACGECENCVAIDKGASYNVIELDAASNNGVDQMRNLTEQVQVPPQLGRYRVFIIDEVHMLSSGAFNAFLKTLEEPPSYAVFILATTEKHKVLPTILSRCQIYDFKRITVNDMAEHLAYVAEQEGVSADPTALNVIARKADGAMRDALSIFDQVAASSGGRITYESTLANLNVLDYDYYFRIIEAMRKGDVPATLLLYKEIRDLGFDSLFFVNGLAEHVRDLMVAADKRTLGLLETADDISAKYQEQASSLPVEWYYVALRLLNECDRDYRAASSKRLLVELTLIRMCQILKPLEPPFDKVDFLPPLQSPVKTPRESTMQSGSGHPGKEERGVEKVETVETAVTPSASVSAHGRGRVRRSAGAPSTISLTTAAHSATEEQVVARGAIKVRSESYTPESFYRVWLQYADSNPKKHLLISAMRAGQPEKREGEHWVVKVANGAQLNAFEEDGAELVSYLRNALSNDNITVNAELDESKVQHKMSRKEMLEKIVSENPVISKVLNDFDCEMV